MNAEQAEVLRLTARPYIHQQVFIGNNTLESIPYRTIGIRLMLFHGNSKQPNPIVIDNIENDINQSISDLAMEAVNGNFNVRLDLVLEPWDYRTTKYYYIKLEKFLIDILEK